MEKQITVRSEASHELQRKQREVNLWNRNTSKFMKDIDDKKSVPATITCGKSVRTPALYHSKIDEANAQLCQASKYHPLNPLLKPQLHGQYPTSYHFHGILNSQ